LGLIRLFVLCIFRFIGFFGCSFSVCILCGFGCCLDDFVCLCFGIGQPHLTRNCFVDDEHMPFCLFCPFSILAFYGLFRLFIHDSFLLAFLVVPHEVLCLYMFKSSS
jgi:hypothetical protein